MRNYFYVLFLFFALCPACGGGDESATPDGGASTDVPALHDTGGGGKALECDKWYAGQAAELRTLADSYKTCVADSDCAAMDMGTRCLGGWTTAIRADKAVDFNEGRDAIADKWCVQPYLNGCEYKPASGVSEGRVFCGNGQCEMDDLPVRLDGGFDGGEVDAGVGDSGTLHDAGADAGADASAPDAGTDTGVDDAGGDGGTVQHMGTVDDPIPLYLTADTPLPLPFSYEDRRDTRDALSDVFDSYPLNTVNESGPEFIYVFTVDKEARVSVQIDTPEPAGTDIDVHLLSSIKPPVLIDRDNLGVYAVLQPGKYFLALDTYVNGSGTELAGPYHLRVEARARDTGASQYFNEYVLKAVDYLYANYKLLGYADAVLTHDIEYGSYGTIKMTGGGKSMCVSAAMETILTAMQVYAQETGDATVWDFLPKRSWEYLSATDIKAHIWVNSGLDSYGTADALAHFGMGENVPFAQLAPGSFINVNRTTGTGHAVVFLSFIDVTGTEYDTWNTNVIGFRYFSSQGGSLPGAGGLDYRYAIFATDEYENNGYPTMPYKSDIHIIKSDDQHILNTGMMFHPENWMPIGPKAFAKLPGGQTDFGPQVSYFDPIYFDGITADDVR